MRELEMLQLHLVLIAVTENNIRRNLRTVGERIMSSRDEDLYNRGPYTEKTVYSES